MTVRVLIRLKPGILDVQGVAVKRALANLGFDEIADLRVGKIVEVDVRAVTRAEAEARVGDMCRKLLVNPILEEFTIEAGDANDLARGRRVR